MNFSNTSSHSDPDPDPYPARTAERDPLTGLLTRGAFTARLEQLLGGSNTGNPCHAVLAVNLRRFKGVNRSLGLDGGDKVLHQAAARLGALGALVAATCRLDGDKFGILMTDVAGEADVVRVAEWVRKTLSGIFHVGEREVFVDTSIGIAMSAPGENQASDMVHDSYLACLEPPLLGTSQIIVRGRSSRRVAERLQLETELRKALDRNELELVYQPVVHAASGRVSSLEALARWRHPVMGTVMPDDFIPLAEQTGLIHTLTMWALQTVADQCHEWDQAGIHTPIAVNISAANLHDMQFTRRVEEKLAASPLPAGWLKLEVTESAIMVDPLRTAEILRDMAAMGVMVSIDDFGIGHSSLAALKNLPVDELKIDKSFVLNMRTDPSDAAIVHGTIDLGHDLGLKVVAEGVEDAETLKMLSDFGCDSAQGYYLGQPAPPAEITRWFRESPWGLGATSATSGRKHGWTNSARRRPRA